MTVHLYSGCEWDFRTGESKGIREESQRITEHEIQAYFIVGSLCVQEKSILNIKHEIFKEKLLYSICSFRLTLPTFSTMSYAWES